MPKKSKAESNLPPPTFYQHSPIDITGSIAAVLPPLEFHYEPLTVGDLVPGATGHGCNVNFQTDAGFIQVGAVKAKLKQLHFHSASEHHVDGAEYPLELHLVHEIEHPKTQSLLMVVGVFFTVASKRKPKEDSESR